MAKKESISGKASRTGTPEGTVILDGKHVNKPVEMYVDKEWINVLTFLDKYKTAVRELEQMKEVAANWQRHAKTFELTNVELAKRIEELTDTPTMTTAGKVPDFEGTTINYHMAEGEIKGPIARIMEAVNELEGQGFYVNFRSEYDSPIKKD